MNVDSDLALIDRYYALIAFGLRIVLRGDNAIYRWLRGIDYMYT